MFLVSIFIYFCSHLDYFFSSYSGFPNNSTDKESAYTARDPNLIPGLERSPGEGIGYPLQYSRASLAAQLVKNLPAMGEFSSAQSLSRVWLFMTPWTAAHQASTSITNSQRLLKLMSIESVMPSNHFILCHPLFLLPSIFPSIQVFSSECVVVSHCDIKLHYPDD